MTSLIPAIQKRIRRTYAAISALFRPIRPFRGFTLRDLERALDSSRERYLTAPPPLTRLLSLVSGDLAVAVRYPERRGGPDTMRSLHHWKTRYDHLDRYLPRG